LIKRNPGYDAGERTSNAVMSRGMSGTRHLAKILGRILFVPGLIAEGFNFNNNLEKCECVK
jgi:hypothetical protein